MLLFVTKKLKLNVLCISVAVNMLAELYLIVKDYWGALEVGIHVYISFVCTYVCVYVCTINILYVCMYVHMYMCMYGLVCMYESMYVQCVCMCCMYVCT